MVLGISPWCQSAWEWAQASHMPCERPVHPAGRPAINSVLSLATAWCQQVVCTAQGSRRWLSAPRGHSQALLCVSQTLWRFALLRQSGKCPSGFRWFVPRRTHPFLRDHLISSSAPRMVTILINSNSFQLKNSPQLCCMMWSNWKSEMPPIHSPVLTRGKGWYSVWTLRVGGHRGLLRHLPQLSFFNLTPRSEKSSRFY